MKSFEWKAYWILLPFRKIVPEQKRNGNAKIRSESELCIYLLYLLYLYTMSCIQ